MSRVPKTSAFEVFSELQLLKRKLPNRKTLNFIPSSTRKELNKLNAESSNNVDVTFKFSN